MGKKAFKALKVKELIELLQNNSDENATVIIGAYNGHVNTYACVDHVWSDQYDVVSNDFFDTPGRMDKRLFDKNITDFTFIGSMFGEYPDERVDFGDDDTNTCIELINGEDGNPNLIWEENGFVYDKNLNAWTYKSTNDDILHNTNNNALTSFTIEYKCSKKILKIICKDYNEIIKYKYEGFCYGIEDLYKALEACRIKKTFII
jgi:hypothetical protein